MRDQKNRHRRPKVHGIESGIPGCLLLPPLSLTGKVAAGTCCSSKTKLDTSRLGGLDHFRRRAHVFIDVVCESPGASLQEFDDQTENKLSSIIRSSHE